MTLIKLCTWVIKRKYVCPLLRVIPSVLKEKKKRSKEGKERKTESVSSERNWASWYDVVSNSGPLKTCQGFHACLVLYMSMTIWRLFVSLTNFCRGQEGHQVRPLF